MTRAHFRFYAELGDLLPPERRGVTFGHEFPGSPTVGEAVESLGVAPAAIDLVLVNDEPVALSSPLPDGARVSVYPVFEAMDIASVTRVRQPPLRETRFVLDGHLGRLARYLRLAGFDARWTRDPSDDELVRISTEESRILLTADRALLRRRAVSRGLLVHGVEPRRQLAEIVERLGLSRSLAPFTRCLCCNHPLEPATPEEVAGRLPPGVSPGAGELRRCGSCGRIYWPGTHRARMERLLLEAAGWRPG